MTPDAAEIWSLSRLGYTLYLHQRLEDAQAIFSGLLYLRPDFVYGWYITGLIRRDLGELSAAARALEFALSCDPKHLPARLALAELRHQLGELPAAQELLRPLILKPDPKPHTLERAALRRAKTLWRRWRES